MLHHQRCHKPSPNCSGGTIVVKVLKFEDIPGRPHTNAVKQRRVPRSCQHVGQAKRREEATKEQEVRGTCLGRRHAQAPLEAPATQHKTTGDTHVRANAPHTLSDTKRKNKNTREVSKDGRTLPAAPPEEIRASPRTRLKKFSIVFPFRKATCTRVSSDTGSPFPAPPTAQPGHSVGFTTGKEQVNHRRDIALSVRFTFCLQHIQNTG